MIFNERLIDHLRELGEVRSLSIEKAMRTVDRGDFEPQNTSPYADRAQPIGYGATISAPHMHAIALEALNHKLIPGVKILDVGCGSGIMCAYLVRALEQKNRNDEVNATIVGIEHINELTVMAKRNLNKNHMKFMLKNTIKIIGKFKNNI